MDIKAANKILKPYGVNIRYAQQGKARARMIVIRKAPPSEPFQTYAIGIFEANNLINGFRDTSMARAIPQDTWTNKVLDGWYLLDNKPGFRNTVPPKLTAKELDDLEKALMG